MKFSKFKEVVTQIRNIEDAKDRYMDSIPTDIRDAFFDNEYTNNQGLMFDVVFNALFGETLTEDVFWFLYEWKPGYSVTVEDREYKIETIDEYFEYIKKEYLLED